MSLFDESAHSRSRFRHREPRAEFVFCRTLPTSRPLDPYSHQPATRPSRLLHQRGLISRMLRPRRLRRATVVVLHLLVVHLTFASGARMCAFGDEAMHGDVAGMTKQTSGPASHSHESHLPGGHRHRGHCDTPCAPADCGVAGHCSGSAVSASASGTSVPSNVRAPTIVRRLDAPHFLIAAPEPPPPRA